MQEKNMERLVDGLGRVIIPKEIRLKMGIDERSVLEVIPDFEAGTILLVPVKYPRCQNCGKESNELTDVLSMKFCPECMAKIKSFLI